MLTGSMLQTICMYMLIRGLFFTVLSTSAEVEKQHPGNGTLVAADRGFLHNWRTGELTVVLGIEALDKDSAHSTTAYRRVAVEEDDSKDRSDGPSMVPGRSTLKSVDYSTYNTTAL